MERIQQAIHSARAKRVAWAKDDKVDPDKESYFSRKPDVGRIRRLGKNDKSRLLVMVGLLGLLVSAALFGIISHNSQTKPVVDGSNISLEKLAARTDSLEQTVSRLDSTVMMLTVRIDSFLKQQSLQKNQSSAALQDTKTNSELQSLNESTTLDPAQKVQRAAASNTRSGLWLINLVSLRSHDDAQQFLRRAKSLGIPAELNEAVVGGVTYWRAQVTGLSSKEEALVTAEKIKQPLGLKDVWITTRE